MAIPSLATLITFSLYTASTPDHFLAPAVAFVALTLFDKLRQGMNILPHSISYSIEVRMTFVVTLVCSEWARFCWWFDFTGVLCFLLSGYILLIHDGLDIIIGSDVIGGLE